MAFLIGFALIFAVFAFLADLSVRLGLYTVAPIWPPAGIAFAGLILGGIRQWPAIFLGLTFSTLVMPLDPIFMTGTFVANIIGPVLAVYLIRNRLAQNPTTQRFRSVFSLYLGGIVLSVVSALIATVGYTLSDRVITLGGPPSSITELEFLSTWMLGDLFGVVVFTPAIISLYTTIRHPGRIRTLNLPWAERLAWIAAALLTALFWNQMVSYMPHYPLALIFLPVLLLGWSALRFEHRFTTTAVMILLVALSLYIGFNADKLPPPMNAFEQGMLMFVFLIIGIVPVLSSSAVMENRYLSNELNYRASHDALTGLPNRVAFEEACMRQIEQADDTPACVCYLDLDNFKVINDTSGHFAGDEQLKQIAYLIRNNLGNDDILARLGGDEFGLLLVDCDARHGKARTEHLIRVIQDYRFIWQSHIFNITTSVGIVELTTSNQNYTQIMRMADVACFEAKDTGGGCAILYSDEHRTDARPSMMHWAASLNSAIDRNQMMLYAQLITPLQDQQCGLHLEILIRMRDDDGQVLDAADFIHAAERFRVMSRIDLWVIESVIRYFDTHPVALDQCDLISVNLSGQSLGRSSFLDDIATLLNSHPEIASKLCFEITETAAIGDLQLAESFIQRIRHFGCRFALDDFGSGLSSFQYLKILPVDYIKIDGIFIRDLVNSHEDRAMVSAIHQVAHVLGKQTIAEYVESGDITASLTELGVDFAQGFHFSKPIPLEHYFSSSDENQPST